MYVSSKKNDVSRNWGENSLAACLLWTCCTIALSGCGQGDGFERVVVSGTVTYQGKPVEDGTIEFIPDTTSQAPVSEALIQQGNYLRRSSWRSCCRFLQDRNSSLST